MKKVLEHKKVQQAHSFVKEFKEFLKEYSILGIAMGLVIGAAVTGLVNSIVSGVVTPLIQLIVPSGLLKDLNYEVGGVVFKIGPIIDSAINFLAVALMFFVFVKLVFKKEKVGKL